MSKVRLLIDIDAEGVHIPAGTVCLVEQRYAADEKHPVEVLDLIAGDKRTGVLFWATADEVEFYM